MSTPRLGFSSSRRFWRFREHARDMAHFAVRPDFELAIEMEAEVGLRKNVAPFLGVLADEIVHLDPAAPRRRPERPAGDRADVLLELRGLRAVERPVAGIVDARGDLIDHESLATLPVARHEQLDRQDADIVERLEDLGGDAPRLFRSVGGDARRRPCASEDVALVLVLAEVVGDDRAFEAARGDDRRLALKGNKALEDHRRPAERSMHRRDVGAFADERLALAVIAEASRLEDRGAAELGHRAGERACVLDPGEARGRQLKVAQEGLLDQPVLGQRERPGPGPDRDPPGEKFDGCGRDVLEFICCDIRRLGEAGERLFVVVRGDRPAGRGVIGRRVGLGRVDVGPKTDLQRCDGEHPAELPCAENADGGARTQNHGSARSSAGRSATSAVRAARHASRRLASASSDSARTEAASSAALTAPASPMASAPTGTPAGIWTIESRLSWPKSALVGTGTPKTGRVVKAAAMPGRCAAPPAPAMTTLTPCSFAPLAKATSRSGVRWAETIRAS